MIQSGTQSVLLERLSALADPVRVRLLLLLERQELTVSELCEVLQMPQSTVSRHLKTLTDGGWLASRPDGTRRLYRIPAGLEPASRELWRLTREQLSDTPSAGQDALRLEGVLAQRRASSRAFFATSAGRWDRLRDDLFGRRFYLMAIAGLLDPDWTVADLGCGTGPVAEAVAPWVSKVIGVDGSPGMVEEARRRLTGLSNVEIRRGELEDLPLDDGTVDAVTLMLVLHHLPDPPRVLAEVARVLRPGGRLLLVDMLPHERLEYREEMGHVWMGFSGDQTREWLVEAGLRPVGLRALPADPDTRGPALFTATATRPGAARDSKLAK